MTGADGGCDRGDCVGDGGSRRDEGAVQSRVVESGGDEGCDIVPVFFLLDECEADGDKAGDRPSSR